MAKDLASSMGSELLDVLELADFLRISRASVYRLVERRLIPFHRLPRGLRFRRDDIEGFLSRCRVETLENEYEYQKIQKHMVG